ncbi:hypothetical protein IAQ61_001834 [Plenodomus lingam]|uniref:uncharacterized protein n=1 Tax=Leptosphaeria maculans TaxID=5022 RepID=UPI00332CA3AF|nr:hypothetical protein IAQ61_001834 [Plenodomus lingam]
MAFNNWDKLSKGQHDFPKPKFANSVVDKALKKQPNSPFLLSWKAELLLSFDDPGRALDNLLLCAKSLSGGTDTRLLAYLYSLSVEAIRKTGKEAKGFGSVGQDFLKPWQTVVKAAGRKSDRLKIWDTLFTTASHEDCWDDVQWAVVNCQKEGLVDKKQIHYIRILVTHLAAEQKRERLGKDDQMTQIQFKVARGQMKQAFQASPDDPIAVKDIRDLRFMAEIYARQGQCSELMDLWKTAPQSLVTVMKTYHDELMNLLARLLRKEGNWELLEAHCLGVIESVISHMRETKETKRFEELSAARWFIWDSLLHAIMELYSPSEAQEKLKRITENCAEVFQSNERPIQRTAMILSQTLKADMLPICKQYWECYSATPSCFTDLRSAVESLSVGQQQEFHQFIQDQTRDLYAKAELEEDKFSLWQQTEVNILKFDYLLTIAMPPSPTTHAMEALAAKAIRFCASCPETTEAAFVAIYTLLHLHNEISDSEKHGPTYEVAPSTRILLQAAMLARHLGVRDGKRENRTLSLLAARLHLNLGLGRSAFRLYRLSKLKEMLLDTLSLYVLARISMTHPFDITGYQGFSAEEELENVVDAIDRMERKTDTFLYKDLPSFIHDQFSDTLLLKRRLKSSLTRQLCNTERRRIARLKGKSTEHIPRLNHTAFEHVSQNLDLSAFPHYGQTHSQGPCHLVMPNHVPDESWMIKHSVEVDATSYFVYQEEGVSDLLRWHLKDSENEDQTPPAISAEHIVQDLWRFLRHYTLVARNDIATPGHADSLGRFQAHLEAMRKAMQSLRLPEPTTATPENEGALFSETMLLACYTKLEVLRATHKFLDLLKDKVVPAKSTHSLKKILPKGWIAAVASEVDLCFQAIQDLAQSYISAIRKTGMAAIKAQVRSGATGKQLCALLSAEDIQFYANEYVDSAVEGWSGVLQVKPR